MTHRGDAERIAGPLRAKRPALDPLVAVERSVCRAIVGASRVLLRRRRRIRLRRFTGACGLDLPSLVTPRRESLDGGRIRSRRPRISAQRFPPSGSVARSFAYTSHGEGAQRTAGPCEGTRSRFWHTSVRVLLGDGAGSNLAASEGRWTCSMTEFHASLTRKGVLPVVRVGPTHMMRFSEAEVQRYFLEQPGAKLA